MAKFVDPFDEPDAVAAQPDVPFPQGMTDPFDSPQSQNPPTIGGTFEGPAGQGPIIQPRLYDSAASGASLGASVKAAFVDDPQQKIRIYAQARFPNDPNAESRYRIVDGQVAYQGSDGNLYLESGGTLKPLAGGLSRAFLPTLGGALGVVGGPAGAAAGAAAGEGYNKLIGNMLGEEQTIAGNAADMALEGGLALAGYGLGSGVARMAEGSTARDIGRYNARSAQDLMSAQNRVSSQLGARIPLEAAQITNLPSVKARSHYMRMMAGEAADTFSRFDEAQDKAAYQAVTRFFDDLSPVDDAYDATARVQGAARGAIDRAQSVATEVGKRYYPEAERSAAQVNVQPIVDDIDGLLNTVKDTKLQSQLQEIRRALYMGDGETLDTSLQGADEVKKILDRMLEQKGPDSLQRRAIGVVKRIRENVIKAAEEASPDDYAFARAAVAPMLEYKRELEQSVIGAIANLKNPKAQTAANMLFNMQSPTVIGRARHAISAEDPEAWNAILRGFLWGKFAKAGQENVEGEAINRGAKFAKAVFGNPEQQKVMRASMTPEQFSIFTDLMNVLKATGRVQRAGSRTEFNRLVSEDLKSEAAPVASALRTISNPTKWAEAFQEYRTEAYAARVAEVMTSPDALSKLKELKKVSPTSRRAMQVVGEVLFLTGPSAVQTKPPQAESN